MSPSTRPALGNMVTSATLGSSDRGMTMTCTLSSSLVGHRHIHSFWFSQVPFYRNHPLPSHHTIVALTYHTNPAGAPVAG